jgi:chitin disaccharide deacetylase
MPNGAAFAHAVRLASERPALGVGLHISLVGESPLSDPALCSPLVEDHSLPGSYTGLVRRLLTNRRALAAAKVEIEKQFECALGTGMRFTHVDSHQHLHVMPGLIEHVLKLARESGIGVVRCALEIAGLGPGGLTPRGIQLAILRMLSRRARRLILASGLRTSDYFWGLGASGQLNTRNLNQVLHLIRPGVNELMCHPGLPDEATRARYGEWGYRWEDEVRALTDSAVMARLSESGARLASFADAFQPL